MHEIATIWMWLGFMVFLIVALTIDTIVLSKRSSHTQVSMRSALYWTLFWITCALSFNGLLWLYLAHTETPVFAKDVALSFFTGYLIEKSLSIDNLFAFYLIFHQFRIPQKYQKRVFSYGIWSAVVFRLILILFGSFLIREFHWLLYVMGIFLMLTGVKMLIVTHEDKDLMASKTFTWLKRHLRITHEFHEENFFVRQNKLLYATPLFIALIFIEITDVIFAMDSIPAIFAITTDPFIVWTSNIFAILGLRAMYFLLAGMVSRLHLLKYGIALILVFVGVKMVVEPWFHIAVEASLVVVALTLILFTVLSLYFPPKQQGEH